MFGFFSTVSPVSVSVPAPAPAAPLLPAALPLPAAPLLPATPPPPPPRLPLAPPPPGAGAAAPAAPLLVPPPRPALAPRAAARRAAAAGVAGAAPAAGWGRTRLARGAAGPALVEPRPRRSAGRAPEPVVWQPKAMTAAANNALALATDARELEIVINGRLLAVVRAMCARRIGRSRECGSSAASDGIQRFSPRHGRFSRGTRNQKGLKRNRQATWRIRRWKNAATKSAHVNEAIRHDAEMRRALCRCVVWVLDHHRPEMRALHARRVRQLARELCRSAVPGGRGTETTGTGGAAASSGRRGRGRRPARRVAARHARAARARRGASARR